MRLPVILQSDCVLLLPNGSRKFRAKPLAKMPLTPPPTPQTIGRITSGPFCWDGIFTTQARNWVGQDYPVFRDGKQIG